MRDIYEVLTNLVSGFIINYFLTICLFDVSYEFAAGSLKSKAPRNRQMLRGLD